MAQEELWWEFPACPHLLDVARGAGVTWRSRSEPSVRAAVPARSAAVALLCVALVAAPGADAGAQAPALRHSPPPRAEAWQPVVLEATLVGDVPSERVATADVVVATSDGSMRSFPLTLSRSSLFGEIPGALVAPPELSYYLRVTDTDGTVVSAPPGAPESGLFVLAVTGDDVAATSAHGDGSGAAAGGTAAEWASATAEILSPLPGEVVAERSPQVAAIFDPPLDEPWDALIVLDGIDVTRSSSITSELFILSPPEPLAKGAHRVTFSAVTATGPVEASWVFFVLERTGGVSEDRLPWRPPDGGAEPAGDSRDATEADWLTTSETWQVSGRLEAGWAAVVAETTAVDSLDVFLPYPLVSRPSVDFYLSGVRGDGTFLITARQDPVYSDDLEWLISGKSGRLEVDVGQIFPSLSQSTLDWAVGQGARVSAKAGRSTTELLGMRVTESDTLAGFGIYSRFAVGGKQSFDWSERLAASRRLPVGLRQGGVRSGRAEARRSAQKQRGGGSSERRVGRAQRRGRSRALERVGRDRRQRRGVPGETPVRA